MDDIGHGIRSGGTPRQKQRAPSQSSIQAPVAVAVAVAASSVVGPAPTTKPPTPPQSTRTAPKGIKHTSKTKQTQTIFLVK